MATRARARIVDDLDCEVLLLGHLAAHPCCDQAQLSSAFPWSRQALADLLNRLAREWRILWRMEAQLAHNGRRRPRRVYWLAPPELAHHADPAAAAKRVSVAMRIGARASGFYFHSGTPVERAGRIQRLAIAGPFIAEDRRRG